MMQHSIIDGVKLVVQRPGPRSLAEQAHRLAAASNAIRLAGVTPVMGAAALSCTASPEDAVQLLRSCWDFPAKRARAAVTFGSQLGRFGNGDPLSAISGAKLSWANRVALAALFDHGTAPDGASPTTVSLAGVRAAASKGELRSIALDAIRSDDRPSIYFAAALLATLGRDEPSSFLERIQGSLSQTDDDESAVSADRLLAAGYAIDAARRSSLSLGRAEWKGGSPTWRFGAALWVPRVAYSDDASALTALLTAASARRLSFVRPGVSPWTLEGCDGGLALA